MTLIERRAREPKMYGECAECRRWTEADKERLKELRAQGLSAAQIANEIADGRSRNAVLGLVHRLGLPLIGLAWTERAPRRRPRREKTNTALSFKQCGTQIPMIIDLSKFDTARPLPGSEPVILIERAAHQCCFPVTRDGQGRHLFCGLPRRDVGTAYCAVHSQMMWHRRG